MKLPQILSTRKGNAKKVFEVRDQRSSCIPVSYAYKYVNAIMVEAYLSIV